LTEVTRKDVHDSLTMNLL